MTTLPSDCDPIAAIATAPGRGGIGVVRVSGRELVPVINGLLGAAAAKLAPRRALYAAFVDAQGRPLDRGLALLFPAPQSYTGETVLELHGHGGPVVLRLLLARCLEAGAAVGLRLAEPGEFTRRAFFNDRLDLAQAEAVADLIDAATATAARSAARSLAGEFSAAVEQLAAELTELRALIEATLDFPDEEIDFLHTADAGGRLARLAAQLTAIQRRSQQGALLRDGLNLVLVGAPNVGKSSLLNRLAGEEVALVTPIAGTTRDRIAQPIQVRGIPVNVIDTAGLRPTEDEVEKLGIARTLAEIERADAVLHLVDAAAREYDAPVLAQVRGRIGAGVPLLTVFNKIDLIGETPRVQGERVWLSAKTGVGLDGLQQALLAAAGWEEDSGAETVYLARERHLHALAQATQHLAQAQMQIESGYAGAQLELFAEELRLAGTALGAITGAVSADDLLGQIFSRFCIGK
jgi:tRNA modification GTPase